MMQDGSGETDCDLDLVIGIVNARNSGHDRIGLSSREELEKLDAYYGNSNNNNNSLNVSNHSLNNNNTSNHSTTPPRRGSTGRNNHNHNSNNMRRMYSRGSNLSSSSARSMSRQQQRPSWANRSGTSVGSNAANNNTVEGNADVDVDDDQQMLMKIVESRARAATQEHQEMSDRLEKNVIGTTMTTTTQRPPRRSSAGTTASASAATASASSTTTTTTPTTNRRSTLSRVHSYDNSGRVMKSSSVNNQSFRGENPGAYADGPRGVQFRDQSIDFGRISIVGSNVAAMLDDSYMSHSGGGGNGSSRRRRNAAMNDDSAKSYEKDQDNHIIPPFSSNTETALSLEDDDEEQQQQDVSIRKVVGRKKGRRNTMAITTAVVAVPIVLIALVVIIYMVVNDNGNSSIGLLGEGEDDGSLLTHSQNNNNNNNNKPTTMTEEDPSLLSLVPNMTETTIEAIRTNPLSRQARAYDFISKDPNWDTFEDWRKQQRFALLCILYTLQSDGDHSYAAIRYNSNECDWFKGTNGCQGDDGHDDEQQRITHFKLATGNFAYGIRWIGSFPEEVAFLPYLKVIDLSSVWLRQTLEELFPTQTLANLPTSLRELILPDCELRGTIPSTLLLVSGLSGGLTNLDLRENQLTGTIPSELGLLSNLKSLDLSTNDLSGTIPQQIMDIPSLTELSVDNNPNMMIGS